MFLTFALLQTCQVHEAEGSIAKIATAIRGAHDRRVALNAAVAERFPDAPADWWSEIAVSSPNQAESYVFYGGGDFAAARAFVVDGFARFEKISQLMRAKKLRGRRRLTSDRVLRYILGKKRPEDRHYDATAREYVTVEARLETADEIVADFVAELEAARVRRKELAAARAARAQRAVQAGVARASHSARSSNNDIQYEDLRERWFAERWLRRKGNFDGPATKKVRELQEKAKVERDRLAREREVARQKEEAERQAERERLVREKEQELREKAARTNSEYDRRRAAAGVCKCPPWQNTGSTVRTLR